MPINGFFKHYRVTEACSNFEMKSNDVSERENTITHPENQNFNKQRYNNMERNPKRRGAAHILKTQKASRKKNARHLFACSSTPSPRTQHMGSTCHILISLRRLVELFNQLVQSHNSLDSPHWYLTPGYVTLFYNSSRKTTQKRLLFYASARNASALQ